MTPADSLPQVYDELRRLAAAKLAREAPEQTLDATALVHEVWLRLAGASVEWQDRSHFLRTAATAMRRILVDRARAKKAAKRDGGHRLELADFPALAAGPPTRRPRRRPRTARGHKSRPRQARRVTVFRGADGRRGSESPRHLPRHRRPDVALREGVASGRTLRQESPQRVRLTGRLRCGQNHSLTAGEWLSTPDQQWLNRVYQTLLHRPIDSIGLNQWGADLNAGTSPTQVVYDIEHTSEYQADEIQGAFQKCLGGAAPRSAVTYLVGLMQNGAGIQSIEAIIVGSPGFYSAAGGTNDTFLDTLSGGAPSPR